MKKLTEFNKTNLKKLRADMDNAISAVGEKYGIEIKGGNWSFSGSTVTMKFEGSIEGAQTAEMLAIEMYSEMDTGTEIKYGDEFDFKSNVGIAKVVAYKTRSPKYPFIVESSDGSRYKMGSESLKRAIGRG